MPVPWKVLVVCALVAGRTLVVVAGCGLVVAVVTEDTFPLPRICCKMDVLITAAVTTPFPSIVRLTGLFTLNKVMQSSPGGGPNDAENLMARKVNRFVAWSAAGEVT